MHKTHRGRLRTGFTAAQAAQKMADGLWTIIIAFTAAQAAQKRCCWGCDVADEFTAAQAAQKEH